MFVARARQQACDFVADLRAAHARPGLPLSSIFGPCPPTPATTPGAQARSRGTRASTKARRKAFQPAQFPGQIVGGLPAPLCLGSSGHSTRVQPEDPHACKPGGLLTTPSGDSPGPRCSACKESGAPCAPSLSMNPRPFLSISISRFRRNPSALANGFILLVDVAEEMKHTQHFFPPEGNSNITHPTPVPVNPSILK